MEPESQEESQTGLVLEPPATKKSGHKKRRRRRSSARFLKLSGRLMEDIDEDEDDQENVESEQNLGDMYKRAIRMNAENRINASNSWNLRLIENIDKFLEEEESPEMEESSPSINIGMNDENQEPMEQVDETPKQRKGGKEKRVNFTKASCTLDASVKIYSYRVDDVHLSSYKVLANLNRTENNDGNKKIKKQKDSQSQGEEGADPADLDSDDEDDAPSKAPSRNADTLESNVANINMNKHDAAYDIDPLFHKMSKTFDEGGAKGLLLVNLNVGDKGCNIVFDSRAEECDEVQRPSDAVEGDEARQERTEGMVDISSLLAKLDTIEAVQPVESMSMVPQLAALREQYSELEADGFVDQRKKPSKRYASTQQEENEADKSIHQEALERSRVSAGGMGRSFQDDYDDDDAAPMFAPDDFGGGDDGDDDDAGFDAFIALDDNGERFSSISFRESLLSAPEKKSQADVLLDAICSGNVLGNAGENEFFDTQALEMSMSENQWAGSAHFSLSHWKRSEPVRKRQEKAKTKKTTRAKKTKKKSSPNVDLNARPVLEDILRKPPKGKRGSNPLQMSKTMVATKTKEDNLLPYDTGVGADKLSSLFLRQAMVQPSNEKSSMKNKTVCFDNEVETFGGGGGFDDSFGEDDDGPGFMFADDDAGGDDGNQDDFVMEELKAVRKVDTKSVQVGYATIAKKVDVKRLKRDLWTGIESSILPKSKGDDVDVDDDPLEESKAEECLSFQDTVRDMEGCKTQVDVTLPFYFICVLHLANEKGLKLESLGLEDFVIRNDLGVTSPSV